MSECIGVCEIDYESGYCVGCGRSVDEIFGPDEGEVAPPASADVGTAPGDTASPDTAPPDTE